MRNLLGNNCAKGCLIYLFALVAVVVLTSMGLSGLGSRFGAEAQKSQISPLYVPSSRQASPATQAAPQGGGSTTRAGANTAATAQPVIQPAPIPTATTPASSQAANAQQTGGSSQAQTGTISGEASLPFYIVQAGDTLWDIARQYDVTVDTLKAVNGTIDEIIKPGELVYLPQVGVTKAQPQQPAPVAPAPAPAPPTNQEPGGIIPTMPQTGINNKP